MVKADETLTGTTTPGQKGFGNNSNEEAHYTPQNWSFLINIILVFYTGLIDFNGISTSLGLFYA